MYSLYKIKNIYSSTVYLIYCKFKLETFSYFHFLKCFHFRNNLLSVFFKTRPNLAIYAKAFLNYLQPFKFE